MKHIDQFNLTGKNALVTGSSQGIGRAMALGLASQGANVIINYAGREDLATEVMNIALSYGVEAHIVQANLAQIEDVNKLYDKSTDLIGNIDILVSNAAVQTRQDWMDISADDFEWQVNVNWRASMRLIQLVAPHMIENKWGRIVTIGSIQQVKPLPSLLIYAASKNAQLGMVKNLATQLGQHNITVNNLAPGVIVTERNRNVLEDRDYRQSILDQIPVGYFGEGDDCVGALLLLCSEAGRYITGVDLPVDGGMHLK